MLSQETKTKTSGGIKSPGVFLFTEVVPVLNHVKDSCESKVTYDSLASAIGVTSRTKMKRIMNGSLGISKKQLGAFAQFFGLNPEEASYLETLRLFEQTTDPDKAWAHGKKILFYKRNHCANTLNDLNEKHIKVLENWYVLPILHYFDLKGASKDPLEIAEAFFGQVSPSAIRETIDSLIDLDLLKKNSDGFLKRTLGSQIVFDGIPTPLVRKFHCMMVDRAKEAVYKQKTDTRFMMSSTLSLPRSMLPVFRDRFDELMTEMIQKQSAEDCEELFQLNCQMFQLASIKKKNLDQ